MKFFSFLVIPGHNVVHSWSIPGPFLVHSWSQCGSFLVHSWFIPGIFLVHSWYIPGIFLVHSWFIPWLITAIIIFILLFPLACCIYKPYINIHVTTQESQSRPITNIWLIHPLLVHIIIIIIIIIIITTPTSLSLNC